MQIQRSVPGARFAQEPQARRPRQRQRPRLHRRSRRQGPELARRRHARAPASRAGRRRCAMRLPKLPGFKNRNRVEYAVVNVSRLDELFADGDVVDGDSLVAKGIIKSPTAPVKVLGDGELTKKLTVQGRQGLGPRQAEDRGSRRDGRGAVLTAISNAFRVPELRRKILFTLAMIALYRLGALHPGSRRRPGRRSMQLIDRATRALGLLGLFSGGALEKFAVFSLGIMPYITSSIIMQLLQGVIPKVEQWAEGGRVRAAQDHADHPLHDARHRAARVVRPADACSAARCRPACGTLPMWFTQPGHRRHADRRYRVHHVDGRAHHPARYRQRHVAAHLREHRLAVPAGDRPVVHVRRAASSRVLLHHHRAVRHRGDRDDGARAAPDPGPVRQARRRAPVYGGSGTYIPLKINGANVVPIIFASAILFFPSQIAHDHRATTWLIKIGNALASGPLNWIARCSH